MEDSFRFELFGQDSVGQCEIWRLYAGTVGQLLAPLSVGYLLLELG